MDGRKQLLEPFKSLQNFRNIEALTAAQNLISDLYANAHPDLAKLQTIVDIILINGECSDNEAIFACREVVNAIKADQTLPAENGFLLLAACNYSLAKLAVDKRKLLRANRALATAFSCLQRVEAAQNYNRTAWQEPHFEYLQYCVHYLQGVIYLANEEFMKSAQHFRIAQGFCVPPHITSGAAILQSYLGMIHVRLGDVQAGFSMLANAERMFDPAVIATSLDWMRHRFNLGCAYEAVQAHIKALVEFEAVLAMQHVLFHPDADFVCLENESITWKSDTHAAIGRIAMSMGNYEKAAQHLADVDTDVDENNSSHEDVLDEFFTDPEEMDWSPLPQRFVEIPNPAFGVDINFFDAAPEEIEPTQPILFLRADRHLNRD